MTKEKNNGGRGGDLLPPFCARPAIIVDLRDAAAFIDMQGDRTRLWVTAETAVRCADRNPSLIDQATRTLENALRREGMLDCSQYPCDPLQCCICRFISSAAG